VRGLPKDKSFLSTQWDKNANVSMDSLNGVRTGVIVYCGNGYVANNKAYGLGGKLVQQFSPEGEGMYANFIKTMRTRKVEALEGDILEGHLSAGLFHMANISYRIAKTATTGEINERMSGHKESVNALEHFQEHLAVNGIDLNKTRATMGPMLTLYHIGQIVFIGKMVCENGWTSLSIPKGNSKTFNQDKFSKPKHQAHFTDEFIDRKEE
jgi:hypothetical protein